MGSPDELRKTRGLPKRKCGYEKRWENQFFQDMPFVGQQEARADRRELQGCEGCPAHLTRGKRVEGTGRRGRGEVTGSRFSWC